MQQALNQAERIRREMEQLRRAEGQKDRNGNQQGNQPGNNGQQRAGSQGQQNGQGQQPGQAQQGQQARMAHSRARVSRVKVRVRGKASRAGKANSKPTANADWGLVAAAVLMAAVTASTTAPAAGTADIPMNPSTRRTSAASTRGWATLPPVSPEAAYNDLMRDIGRLRNSVTDDKDLAREFQDLMRRAQQLDPRHMNNDPQLSEVIGAQAFSEIDEVELRAAPQTGGGRWKRAKHQLRATRLLDMPTQSRNITSGLVNNSFSKPLLAMLFVALHWCGLRQTARAVSDYRTSDRR